MLKTDLEPLPEGYRIRRIARAIESRRNAEHARVLRRVREALRARDHEQPTFDPATIAWFRRPLGS